MCINDFVDENLIELNLSVSTKEEAIIELSKLLKKNNYILDIDDFVRAVYEREKLGITGMGGNVAIPHGQSDTVLRPGIVIGRNDKLIKWESIDDEPIDLIFMFCINYDKTANVTHLKMLSQVACKLADENRLIKLRKIENKSDFIKTLTE